MFFKEILIASLAFLTVSFAEPPRWRSNSRFSRLQRYEATPPVASQWKPSAGPPQSVPHTVYGPPIPAPSYGPPAPAPSYGPPPPPSSSYGPPPQEYPSLTTETSEGTTTELSITTEVNSESISEGQSGKLKQKPNSGVYFIYHPSGTLQKVTYSTNDDVRSMAFNARLKYQNVEPISGPIYTYDPQTFVFQKLHQ